MSMGVYIEGMEIPTEEYGPMTIKVYPNGHVAEYIGDIGRVWDAVPVPPHGRLIDADKLGIRDAEKQAYEAYLREKGEFFTEEPLLEYMRGRLEGLTDACGRVRFAPTIIPAESITAEEEKNDK
jgi:hypothetical protein